MGITVRDAGGVNRTITGIKVLDGTLLRTIFRVKVVDTDGTTIRTVATFSPPMTASASPSSISGSATSLLPTTVTTNATTVTPSGGTGPYTYAWSVAAYDAAVAPTFSTPTSATTAVSQSGVEDGGLYGATVICTVTDAFGQTAIATVTALFSNNSPI